jgi:putative peptidoglycan lipid II flippase
MSAVGKPFRALSKWGLQLRQVHGATIALVVTGVLGRAISLLTYMVIASQFGLSIASDAFFAAENVPELCINFLAFGLCTVFIPLYFERKVGEGDEKAEQFASSFHVFSGDVSGFLTLLVVAGAPLIVSAMFPGFPHATREMTIRLFRIMALSIFLFGLGGGLRGLLHSYKDFITPEIAVMGYNVTLLIFAAVFSRTMGVDALAWGVVAGAGLNFVILLVSTMSQRIFRASHRLAGREDAAALLSRAGWHQDHVRAGSRGRLRPAGGQLDRP